MGTRSSYLNPCLFHPNINGHETCINALRCLVSAIVAAKEKYHSSTNKNEKAVRLAKVMGNQQRAQKTDDLAMQLEEEETLPPATLASLTDQKVEKKTKPIKQDMAAVKKEMEKLKKQLEKLSTSKNSPKSNKSSNNSTKAKSSPRGADGSVASPKQSSRGRRGQGTSPSSTNRRGRGRKDDDKGNVSRDESSTTGSRRQRSKSPKNNSRRRRGRGKSSSRGN
jgi:predicted transcriptional regulator